MDYKSTFSYDFLPEEGGSVFGTDHVSKKTARKEAAQRALAPQTRGKAPAKAAAPSKRPILQEERRPKEKIDPKKLIIYSEIMNPKFKE